MEEQKEENVQEEAVEEAAPSDADVTENDTSQDGLQDEGDEEKDLDFILDIPLEISVELGRTKMIVNDLLKLGQGAIVELAKLADAPMDVYVNRKLFARGEVVVVNEKFGIRLTDIISPIERVKSLG